MKINHPIRLITMTNNPALTASILVNQKENNKKENNLINSQQLLIILSLF